MATKNTFWKGFKSMLPIAPGIIPFGAIMGTVCAEAQLTLVQAVLMNVFVFAGASQLAAIDLMGKHAPVFVVVLTGLIINMRFLLYSAAISPVLARSPLALRVATAYFLTDQSYAVMTAQERKLKNHNDMIVFYFGAALSMVLIWHGSVVAGYTFGNFAPPSWGLDYAIPLSFVSLLTPALKDRSHIIVAVFSAVTSVLLRPVPYNLGLIITALLAIGLGLVLMRRRRQAA